MILFFGTSYTKQTDEELMIALSKGEKRAFDVLYERYSQKLVGYFKNMLGRDQEKAEDMAHDLFAKIIRNPAYFDTSRTFRIWLFSVASNMCKNEYKKMAVRSNTVRGAETHHDVRSNQNVLQEVQNEQFKAAFETGVEELDLRHREVFMLRHFEGLSMKEIAEMLEINEGTVKSRLFYATKYLANKLQQFNPAFG